MNIRLGLGGAVAGILLYAGAALAGPTANIDGIVVPTGFAPGGNTLESGNLAETLISGSGQNLQGIGLVGLITDSNFNTTWTNGQNGVELAYYFTGYNSSTVTAPTATTPGSVDFNGAATVNFYVLPAGTQISGNGSIAADIAVVTGGALFLSTTAAPEDASGDTLASTIPAGSVSLDNFNGGFGGGFLDVTGGDAAFNFATHTFANAFDPNNNGHSDLSFTSDFSSGAGGDFPIAGSASLKANAVPEPMTIGLFGAGLAGLGLARRRKGRS